MKKKQILYLVLIFGFFLLVYTQFRTWRKFDWNTFLSQTHGISWLAVLAAVALTYAAYVLRAVRWNIFLRPIRAGQAQALIAPTVIGFTSVALLGRAGELVRPYLIARKEKLSMASQMGVWMVERIFDLGAFAVLIGVDVFAARHLPNLKQFRVAGLVLLAVMTALAGGAVYLRRHANSVAGWLQRRLQRFSARFAKQVAAKAQAFADGLHTIHDRKAFLQLAAVSLLMWIAITLAHFEVVHSYPALRYLPLSNIVLLVGFTLVGGLVQLPAVGGGAQLATILALAHIFKAPRELAVSCGILLWVVGFVAVIPAGLVLAHREHVSIRRLSQASQETEEKTVSQEA